MLSSDDARRLRTLKYGIEERDKFLPPRAILQQDRTATRKDNYLIRPLAGNRFSTASERASPFGFTEQCCAPHSETFFNRLPAVSTSRA